MLTESDAPDDSPSGNASSDAIGRRLDALSPLLFPTSLTISISTRRVAYRRSSLRRSSRGKSSLFLLRPFDWSPIRFFISTLPAGSSLDPARGGDLLETEAARSQNSNLWLPRALLSVGFNFQN